MAIWPYNTEQWQRVRARVLVRDSYECALKFPCCVGRATTVHHVVPPTEGGHPFARDNLVSACRPCNTAERNMRHAAAWRREQGLDDVPSDDEVRQSVSTPW